MRPSKEGAGVALLVVFSHPGACFVGKKHHYSFMLYAFFFLMIADPTSMFQEAGLSFPRSWLEE